MVDTESQLVLLSDGHTWTSVPRSEYVSFLDHNHVAYTQIITVRPIKSQSNSHGQSSALLEQHGQQPSFGSGKGPEIMCATVLYLAFAVKQSFLGEEKKKSL